jgi:2-oxoglutarate dehydrogenase E2 component (dihydrolipoamide succinyltransferase)
MNIQIKTPPLPESITTATILKWHKKEGDTVLVDENILDLETDKIVLEVPATDSGIVTEIKQQEGAKVSSDDVLGVIQKQDIQQKNNLSQITDTTKNTNKKDKKKQKDKKNTGNKNEIGTKTPTDKIKISPLVRKLLTNNNLDIKDIKYTNDTITRADVLEHINNKKQTKDVQQSPQNEIPRQVVTENTLNKDYRMQQRVPMTPLRAKIAENLLKTTQNTAMLTTFNEVNMEHIISLRSRYQEKFQQTFGVKLGFMSFFVKASCESLKSFPEVNAILDGNDIVYNNFYDISIAISTEFGLVAPVIKNAELLNLAEIEKQVATLSQKAKARKLTLEEITGGTFTISNGGVFGSLSSTPLLNPPQSAVLGMHSITKRAVVQNDQIVIKPMMNIALSYDHRLIDGKSAISCLRTIKEILEDPARMVLSI